MGQGVSKDLRKSSIVSSSKKGYITMKDYIDLTGLHAYLERT